MSPADTLAMKRRASTLDRIGIAYAEAVASGDLESAEGWLATAAFVAEREARRDRRPRVGITGRSFRRSERVRAEPIANRP
jgi:hypothetical protein